MLLRIGKPKDALAGAIFIAIGGAAWIGAESYRIGTATRMGPGYFPRLLGMLLVGLGSINLLRSLSTATDEAPAAPRSIIPLLLILAGVVCFGLLVDRAGLVAAIAALLVLACAPQFRDHPFETLILFVVLSVFAVVVFIDAFSMPLRAF